MLTGVQVPATWVQHRGYQSYIKRMEVYCEKDHVFRASAIDAEDEPLDETGAITWTSSLSGTLGAGGELWVSGLSTGTHRITMTVADSDGDVGADEITIFVGVEMERIYLPLVLRDFS